MTRRLYLYNKNGVDAEALAGITSVYDIDKEKAQDLVMDSTGEAWLEQAVDILIRGAGEPDYRRQCREISNR